MGSQILSPTTMANDATVGTNAWVNPDNAKASDSVYTTLQLVTAPYTSHWLKATNFNFSVPDGATINGILVECEAKISQGVWVIDYVRIVKGGVIKSTNNTLSPYSFVDAYKSAGGTTNLWGETWTPTDINASDFGVAIATFGDINSVNFIVSIDHIRITVYYTGEETGVTHQAEATISSLSYIRTKKA